jgi:uncharacterized protein (DUF2237 family)
MLEPFLWRTGMRNLQHSTVDPTLDDDVVAMSASFMSDDESDRNDVVSPAPQLWIRSLQPTAPTSETPLDKLVVEC